MRKQRLILFLLLIATVFAAGAHTRRKSKKQPAKKPVATASETGISSIMMRRGACYGRCQEYTITVHKDGTAVFNGVRNLETIGVYEKKVDANRVAAIFAEFMGDRVDTCQSFYKAIIPDVPGLYYEFNIDGKKKVIGNAHFGPVYLPILANEIDAAVGKPDTSWKKLSDKAGD